MYGKFVVNEEDILTHYDNLDIFYYYIEGFEDIDIPFCSELREDNSPSCSIQIYKGIPFYKDFGTGESYNAYSYVMKKFECEYYEALKIIYRDMVLGENNNISPIGKTPRDKSPSRIEIKNRPWNSEVDRDYWMSYYLDPSILNFFNVYPLEYFVINGKLIEDDHPIYAFKFDRGVYKILRPYSDYKWTSNAGKDYYQGYDQLPWIDDHLIITSSMKDVMCLYLLGYNAIAPQSETQRLPIEFLRTLKDRFEDIIMLLDNDDTGIKYSRIHYEEHGIPYTFIKNYKDPSELVKGEGPDKAKHYLKCTLKGMINH